MRRACTCLSLIVPCSSTACRDYKPELDRLIQERDETKEKHKQEQLARLVKDMSVNEKTFDASKTPSRQANEEEDLHSDEDDEGEIIDRSDQHFLDIRSNTRGDTEADGSKWPAPR